MTNLMPFPFNIMFPGAAGNVQSFDARAFSPTYTFNFAGNAAIEREVSEEVASYGRQIGRLGDALEVLLRHVPLENLSKDETDALDVLKGQLAEIRQIKERQGRKQPRRP